MIAAQMTRRQMVGAVLIAVVMSIGMARMGPGQVVGSVLCTEAALEWYWEPLWGSLAEEMQWLYCCLNFPEYCIGGGA